MAYFAVTRRRGPAWDPSRPMTAQKGWPEHAGFMNGLVQARFVILGGPLGDGATVLLIVDAESEAAIHDRLAVDPWTPMDLLPVISVQPWQIMLGETKLPGSAP